MSLKEILNRIKKLEDRATAEDMVTLICLEDGEERRKVLPSGEAAMMALRQGAAQMFKGGILDCKIVGVESGDDDGFIKALLSGEDIEPAEVRKIIEV